MSDPSNFAERGIHSADIWSFNKVTFEDGTDGVSTTVPVYLESKDNPDFQGPRAQFEFGFVIGHDNTLSQIEDMALEAASAFMRRLGKMTAAELRQAIVRGQKLSLLKPSE